LAASDPGLLGAELRLPRTKRRLAGPEFALPGAKGFLWFEDRLRLPKRGGITNDVGGGALTHVK
jgi:hypothetical protein